MSKVSGLVKAWQSFRAGNSEAQQTIVEILTPVTAGTDVEEVTIESASQFLVNFKARFKGKDWDVELKASFHGAEVHVKGWDDGKCAKAHIVRAFNVLCA